MTGSNDDRHTPGATLLRIAPLLFNEKFMSTVVQPTIADLQAEFAAAGGNRTKRLRARWRGYCAFWALTLAAPFASWSRRAAWSAPSPETPAAALSRTAGRMVDVAAVLTLVAICRAMLGVSYAIVAAAGALFAVVIHAWYERHPTDLPAPPDRPWRTPQINFSSTDVAGNVGGLIFVVGSLLVVSIAVPTVLWFLAAGIATGGFLAWRLVAWHTSHPKWGLPENRIVLR
jgi:hypothetical protein